MTPNIRRLLVTEIVTATAAAGRPGRRLVRSAGSQGNAEKPFHLELATTSQ
jgi:hypothetical protein